MDKAVIIKISDLLGQVFSLVSEIKNTLLSILEPREKCLVRSDMLS